MQDSTPSGFFLDDLPAQLASDIEEFWLTGDINAIHRVALNLAQSATFASLRHHVLLASLVGNRVMEPMASLKCLSYQKLDGLTAEEKKLLAPLVDQAFHIEQDEEFGFRGVDDMDAVLLRWTSFLRASWERVAEA